MKACIVRLFDQNNKTIGLIFQLSHPFYGSGELGDRLTIARVRQACGAALRQAFEAGWQRALRRFSLGANNLFAFSKDVCFLGGH